MDRGRALPDDVEHDLTSPIKTPDAVLERHRWGDDLHHRGRDEGRTVIYTDLGPVAPSSVNCTVS